MMLPNQISGQRFSAVGKGGYRATEVDAFVQRVYQNYNKLYNENNVLKERLSAITPLIDEYNENKRAIADALIWAKTTSDKTIEQAQQEAKEIIDAATSEGEKLIAEKTAEAQAVYLQELNSTKAELENAKTELEMTRSQAKSFSERYIAEINAKATSIIEDANANASKIVADAYKDAQTARDKADAIISKTNEELASIKAEAAALKAEIEKAARIAAEAVASFGIDEIEPADAAAAEVIEAKQIDMDEIEEFSFDFDAKDDELSDETEKAAGESAFKVEDIDYSDDSDCSDETSDYSDAEPENEEKTVKVDNPIDDSDLISGGSSAAMPDVSAYISKIFDSAGSGDGDFSSFSEGLDEAFARSLEDSDMSFEDLKKVIESSEADGEGADEE